MHLSDIASQIPQHEDEFTREIRSRYNMIEMNNTNSSREIVEIMDIPMTEFQVFDSQEITSLQHSIIKSPVIEQLVMSPLKSPLILSPEGGFCPQPQLSINYLSPTNSIQSIKDSPKSNTIVLSQNSILLSPVRRETVPALQSPAHAHTIEIPSQSSVIISSKFSRKAPCKNVINSPESFAVSPLDFSQNSILNSSSPPKRKSKRALENSPLLVKSSQESKIKRKLKEISYDLPESEYEELRELDDFIEFNSPKPPKKIKKYETPSREYSVKSKSVKKSKGVQPTKIDLLPKHTFTPSTKPVQKSFTEPKRDHQKPEFFSERKNISDILKNFDYLLDKTKSKEESDFENDVDNGKISDQFPAKTKQKSKKVTDSDKVPKSVSKSMPNSTAYDSLNRYSTKKSVPVDSDSDMDGPVKEKPQSKFLGLFANNSKKRDTAKDTPKRSTLNLDDLERTVINKQGDTLGLFDDDSDLENNSHTTITNSYTKSSSMINRLSAIFDNNLTKTYSNPPPKKSMWSEYDSDVNDKSKSKFETPVPTKTYYQRQSEQYEYKHVEEEGETYFDLKKNETLGPLANYFTQFSSEGKKHKSTVAKKDGVAKKPYNSWRGRRNYKKK
ncbi:hypothetical protein HDV06_003999 [Boothiomyces sp. JEL0866]|nr:hypothetical protein HDV06_003999 [Boothiomyces sp. JEL0866]